MDPEPWQTQALELVRDNSRIAIRSGHGVGKSAMLSWLVIWWLLTRSPAKVACTAPTSHQLETVLWGEIAAWVRKLPDGLRELLEVKSDAVYLVGDERETFAVSRTSRREQPEAFQGFHSKHMLFIADEASGIDDVIYEVGRGSMSTPGAKTVLCGNPTRTSGYFFDAFHSKREFWATLSVSVKDLKGMVPSDPAFAKEMEDEYGQDSNIYRIRVLGEFPFADEDAIIPLHLVESAVERKIDAIEVDEVWGLDVARFGSDRTALARRSANVLVEPIRITSGKDAMQVVGWVKDLYDSVHRKPETIYVDAVGLGAGVADRLIEHGMPVVCVNAGELPPMKDKFTRMRDEMWWSAREWFSPMSVSIPRDDGLIAELTTRRFHFTSSGKVQAETKDEQKKRLGGRSPDKADAFCLTFAHGAYRYGKRNKTIKYPKMGYV